MADYRIVSDLRREIQQETDTEGEEFVDQAEYLTWINDGINKVEAHIHNLQLEARYFQKEGTPYDLTIGQSQLTMPSDIYADKIKALIFDNGSDLFPIKRLRDRADQNRYQLMQEIRRAPNGRDRYRYDIFNNDPTVGPVIQLFPSSNDAGTGIVKVFYIRNALRVTADTDRIDIPEFYSTIKAFVKWKIFSKEGTVLSGDAKAEFDEELALMLQTLQNQVGSPEESLIDPDMSFYLETT